MYTQHVVKHGVNVNSFCLRDKFGIISGTYSMKTMKTMTSRVSSSSPRRAFSSCFCAHAPFNWQTDHSLTRKTHRGIRKITWLSTIARQRKKEKVRGKSTLLFCPFPELKP
jgi:hypothetical protein